MLIFLVFFLHIPSILGSSVPTHFAISARDVDLYKKNITIRVTIPSRDFLYKDYFHFSVDHPDVELSEWKANIQAKRIYDPVFKETKQIYYKNCVITLTASADKHINELINLHVMYYQRSERKIKQFLWPFFLSKQEMMENNQEQHTLDETKISENKKTEQNFIHHYFTQYVHYLKNSTLYELLFIGILFLSILLCSRSDQYAVVEYLHKSDSALNIFLSIILYQLGLICALFLLCIIFLLVKQYYPHYQILYQNIFSVMYLSSGFLLIKNHKPKVTQTVTYNPTCEFNSSNFFVNGIKTAAAHSLSIIPSLMLLFNEYKTVTLIPFCWIIVCISIVMIIKSFFIQKKSTSLLVRELINISSTIGRLLFFCLALYMLHINNKPIVIILTLLTLSVYFGCSFIKMSTKLEHHKLRSFTSMIGSIFIITSVYLFFTALKKLI